jgi:hypothetical protein
MKLSLVPAAALLAAVPEWAAAQDFQVGARPKAMGGSYTAFGDDPVSIWANPAGTAGQPTQFSITYQSFTQYEFSDFGVAIPADTIGEPEQGLLDPPISPAFAGFVVQLGDEDLQIALSLAYVRPFQIKYVYLFDDPGLGTLLTQTDQQFSRVRGSFAMGFKLSEESKWFKRLAVGVAFDYAYTKYKEIDQNPDPDAETLVFEDSEFSPGYGVGLLLDVYQGDSFKLDLGLAYNSHVGFQFDLDPAIYPVWDWPALASAGLAIYLFEGYPLRLTFDVQWIDWPESVGEPLPGLKGFDETISFSMGAEYRIEVGTDVWLFPRAGFKLYDTPWGPSDDLPWVGESQLQIRTKGDTIPILTLGMGVYWSRKTDEEETRLSGLDLAVELFGETDVLLGLGFTYQFD